MTDLSKDTLESVRKVDGMSTTTTVTKERGIIFTAESVRSILAGTKTQTRRAIGAEPFGVEGATLSLRDDILHALHNGEWVPLVEGRGKGGKGNLVRCPYGRPGDRLWVREAFYIDHVDYLAGKLPKEIPADVDPQSIYYPADARRFGPWCCQLIPECSCAEIGKPKSRNPLHMPRWASRLTLEITDVRVQQVQKISEEDARAEGIVWNEGPLRCGHTNHLGAFASTWDALNAARGFPWKDSPWVWAISFKVVTTAA